MRKKVTKRRLFIFGISAVSILAVALWWWPVSQTGDRPTAAIVSPQAPEASRKALKPAPSAQVHAPGAADGGAAAVLASGDDNGAPAAPVAEDRPSDEFIPTAEQELHYQKTQIFMDEARESLPLLGIRAFNPIEAGRYAHRAAIQAAIESDGNADGGLADTAPAGDEEAVERDGRGLQDGEVWIRVNAAQSGEYREIMAQTADLYRVNTGFEGDVTVIVWVGGQPWARESFGAAW